MFNSWKIVLIRIMDSKGSKVIWCLNKKYIIIIVINCIVIVVFFNISKWLRVGLVCIVEVLMIIYYL